MNRASALLRKQGEVAAVAAVLLFTFVTVGLAPVGVFGLGGVEGARLALQAVGLVLVYRANRVINFAQLAIGAVAGTMFLAMVQRRAVLQGVHALCPPCLPAPKGALRAADAATGIVGSVSKGELAARAAPHWMVQADFLVSGLLAVALAIVLLWVTYILLIKRFVAAPRLVLTVVMIAAGEVVVRMGSFVLDLVFRPTQGNPLVRPQSADVPVNLKFSIGPAVFRSTDVAIVVVAFALAACLVYVMRRSTLGVVLRGSAENPGRAETLGINVGSISSRAWLMAGALSGLASVLLAAKSGSAGAGDYAQLVRVLGAAVVGGFVSFPLTLVGAIAIGVIDQVVTWNTNSEVLVASLLFLLILAVLLVLRRRASRAEVEAQGTWEASREIRPIPAELNRLDVVRRTVGGLGVVVGIVALGYPWVMSPGQVEAGVGTMVVAMVALSLLVLTGWAGQISLGQMAFATIGGFAAAALGLPFLLALVVGGAAGAAAALAVGIPALRLRGLTMAVATLAFGLAVPELFLSERYLGKALPSAIHRPLLLGIDFNDERAYFYLTLVLLALMATAVAGIRRSDVARVLIASKDNEQAAQSLGISLYRARLTAFAISGCIAAVAGVVLAYEQRGLHLASFGAAVSVQVFLLAIIGGLGALSGPILGALYQGGLQVLAATPFAPIAGVLLSPGVGVVVLLIAMPGGLAQGLFGLRDAWLRRVASRNRIDVPSLVADKARSEGEPFRLAPKLRPTGAPEFVPVRYRTEGQWMVEKMVDELRTSGKASRPRAVRHV